MLPCRCLLSRTISVPRECPVIATSNCWASEAQVGTDWETCATPRHSRRKNSRTTFTDVKGLQDGHVRHIMQSERPVQEAVVGAANRTEIQFGEFWRKERDA